MVDVLPESFRLDDIPQEYTWTLPMIQDAEKVTHTLLRGLRNEQVIDYSAMTTDLLRLQSYLPQYDLVISRLQSYLPRDDLEISHAQLKCTLSILDVTKRCISQCSLFYQSSLAPIRRLPVEILGIVFEEACTLPTFGVDSPVTFPMTLSSVCFHWRSICLSTPSVWSNITARHTSSDSSNLIARINHYQSRSLNHALTFDLTATFDKASQKEIASTSHIVTPSFLDRCSTVRFTMTGRGRAVYNTLTFSPLLKSVEICCMDHSMKPWTMFREARSVQRLHIHGLQGPGLWHLFHHPITTLSLSRCSSNLLWRFVEVTRATLIDCMGESISEIKTATYISLLGPIRPAPRPLESLSLTNTLLSPIITNPYFTLSHLVTLEITLTPDSQLPAVTLLNDLHYGLVSRSDPLPMTSLSLRYVPISDAMLINILDRIRLLRKLSVVEPNSGERSNHLPVITERLP
ncbi:hypothetical protein F5146DRAFT_487303 [Armillaria mellea]|nr:hypothetical protein F5146DRAFT_487303 [Armillaria mellea]